MTYKTLTAIVLTAGLATPAFAAMDRPTTKDNEPAKMQNWDSDVRGSFFKDEDNNVLYPQQEAMGNFAQLSDAQKERVRQECMTAPNSEINPGDGVRNRDQAFNTLCLWVRGEPRTQ